MKILLLIFVIFSNVFLLEDPDSCITKKNACWRNVVTLSFASDVPSKYGTYRVAGKAAYDGTLPGGRSFYNLFKSIQGFYLFGGFGCDEIGTKGELNDLWLFNEKYSTFTWLSGEKNVGAQGNYVSYSFDQRNSIGARQKSHSFQTKNELCIFGGKGIGASGNGQLGDMFCFSINSLNWRFVGGSNKTEGTNFYQGIDFPGQRYSGSYWNHDIINTDKTFFYLFGGYAMIGFMGYYLNDFWKFDTLQNTWLKIGIPNDIIPGFSGISKSYIPIFSKNNYPGGRSNSITWIYGDSLFIFGGDGVGVNGNGLLNDIWEYNTFQDIWRFVSGKLFSNNENEFDVKSVYDTSSYAIGSRKDSVAWESLGSLYLYAGYGYDDTNLGMLTDIWKFDLSTKKWSLFDLIVTGDSINEKKISQIGRIMPLDDHKNYGIHPSSRYEMKGIVFGNRLYMFGGKCYPDSKHYNDMWYIYLENKCYGIYMSENPCNGNGFCIGENTCSCQDNTYGSNCQFQNGDNTQINMQNVYNNFMWIPIAIIIIDTIVLFLIFLGALGLILFVLIKLGILKGFQKKIINNLDKKENKINDNNKIEDSKSTKKQKKKKKKKTTKTSFAVARLSFV